MKRTVWAILLAVAAWGAAAPAAQACAVCFGDPNSNMARSALAGVMFLGAVIVSVLVTIASLAICWSRRAKQLESQWLTEDVSDNA